MFCSFTRAQERTENTFSCEFLFLLFCYRLIHGLTTGEKQTDNISSLFKQLPLKRQSFIYTFLVHLGQHVL